MSTKKVQEGSDPATPEAKAAPPATTTVQHPATNPSVPATQTTGQTTATTGPATPTTGTTQGGGTTVGNPVRPTRVDIPGYYQNPNGRIEVVYNQPSPKAADAKKATFIGLRAFITGEGDKILDSQAEKTKPRKWTFGKLQPPVFDLIPEADSQTI